MDAPQRALPRQRNGRLRTGLAVVGVLSGIGVYSYLFPHGPLNALLGVTPSTGTEACVGLLRSPLCYAFGWTTAEEAPFSVEYREARIRMVASKHGVSGDVRISGGPQLSQEDDLAGYRYWLGHASAADFEKALLEMDSVLGLRSRSPGAAEDARP